MSWSGGVYTKGNAGSGGWAGDAAAGIGIEAGRHDTQDNDFATGINQCLNKDGSNAATGNLNLNSNKITNLANASASGDAMAYGQIRNGTPLYLDTTNNRLGIGTTTPGANLAIDNNTTVQGSYGALITQFSNDIQGADINLRKSRSGTLGTNTIVQNGDLVGALRFWGANGTGYDQCGVISYVIDGAPGATNDMPTALQFYTRADGAASLTERMRISNGGFASINDTPDSTYRLRIGGRLRVGGQASGDSELAMASQATPANTAWQWAVRPDIGGSNDDLKLMRFVSGAFSDIPLQIQSSSGNVGLGTASPSYRLQLGSDSAAKPTTNTWTIASDARIKTNIQEYVKGLEDICKVRPITYDYNGKGGIPAGPGGVSIIAQEIQSVFPNCVGSYKAKLNEDDEEESHILNYNGHEITFALINAIKELNAKVKALEARIAALES